MDILKKVEAYRSLQKRPIKSLSKPLGLSNTQTYKIFKGKSKITVEQLETICEELGLKLEICLK